MLLASHWHFIGILVVVWLYRHVVGCLPAFAVVHYGRNKTSLVSRNIVGVLLASHWHFIGILVVVRLTLALE